MSGRFEFGARFELLRAKTTGTEATYRATISWPTEHAVAYNVTVPGDGEIDVCIAEPADCEPEDWRHEHLRAMLTTLVKGGRRTGKWPRRLNVWKEAPSSD